jgi:hypothetical protein
MSRTRGAVTVRPLIFPIAEPLSKPEPAVGLIAVAVAHALKPD